MDALKVYDVKKICDARLCIVDMAAAFVRALVTVLLMGRVAVLYRYCAVLVTLFCTRGRLPASPAALCTRGRRPARSPSAPRAFGSARRLEARPGPAAALGHYLPAYCTVTTKPTQASSPPSDTAASRALHGHHKHAHASSPPSGTAGTAHCTVTAKHTHAPSPPSGTADTESGSHSKHPRARGPGVVIRDRGAKTTCPRRSPCG